MLEKNLFPKPKSVGKRPWGEETLLCLIPKVLSLKELRIKKGNMGGIQYHHKKNECGIVVKGKLKIKYDNGKGKLITKILEKGSVFHFPPGLVHQEIAITDCIIHEASSPHFNDRVRVDEKYGKTSSKGLKSTKKSDVVLK